MKRTISSRIPSSYFLVCCAVMTFRLLLGPACQFVWAGSLRTMSPPKNKNTLVSSLIGPFGASFDRHSKEIYIDHLLEACKNLKNVMNTVGQTCNARDLGRNIQKVEQARTIAPKDYRKTLRSLLVYEKKCGVRGKGGRLKENSAAMGLLWIRRSLAFQYRMNQILVDHPQVPAAQAALQAYKEEVEPYHSWGLQKVFKTAFRTTTPPRSQALAQLRGKANAKLSPWEEEMTVQELRMLVNTWSPLLKEWKSTYISLDLEDETRV